MIKLSFAFDDWAKKFKDMQQDLAGVLAASMQTNRAMMFDKDGADNGKPKWADLKLRAGRPLQDTGTLRKSFAPRNDGVHPGMSSGSVVKITDKTVTIGTDLLYARMMNDGTVKMPGGVLRPVKAQALKIPLQGKGKFMFRKSVKIPARPMDTITNADEREFAETLSNYIAERLQHG